MGLIDNLEVPHQPVLHQKLRRCDQILKCSDIQRYINTLHELQVTAVSI